MTLRFSTYALLLALGFSLQSTAAPRPPKWVVGDAPAHCLITITAKKRASGATETIAFRSALKTDRQCRKLAELHEPNFNPETDETKQVAFRWSGAKSPAKKSKLVAKRSRR